MREFYCKVNETPGKIEQILKKQEGIMKCPKLAKEADYEIKFDLQQMEDIERQHEADLSKQAGGK